MFSHLEFMFHGCLPGLSFENNWFVYDFCEVFSFESSSGFLLGFLI